MIRYSLLCDNGHGFEAWFRNSGDYDVQSSRGLIACPVCSSPLVSKALMAPAVATAEKRAERQQVAQAEASAEVAAATTAAAPAAAAPSDSSNAALVPSDARYAELVSKLRELRAQMTANADYVGSSFAEEARKMHYGEADHRDIYGETNAEDARSLLEEGINVLPLPVLPEERN